MKKILSIVVVLMMIGSLAGCKEVEYSTSTGQKIMIQSFTMARSKAKEWTVIEKYKYKDRDDTRISMSGMKIGNIRTTNIITIPGEVEYVYTLILSDGKRKLDLTVYKELYNKIRVGDIISK